MIDLLFDWSSFRSRHKQILGTSDPHRIPILGMDSNRTALLGMHSNRVLGVPVSAQVAMRCNEHQLQAADQDPSARQTEEKVAKHPRIIPEHSGGGRSGMRTIKGAEKALMRSPRAQEAGKHHTGTRELLRNGHRAREALPEPSEVPQVPVHACKGAMGHDVSSHGAAHESKAASLTRGRVRET